jgi:rhamnose transport system ATP-binding protein
MQHVSKRFDATQAVEDVSLTLYPGEVHALIGENGAGKSTLIKIMTGVHRPDTGEILLDGKPGAHPQLAGGAGAGHRRHLPGADGLPRPQRGGKHLHQPPQPRRIRQLGAQMYRDAEAILAQLDVGWMCACRRAG